MSGNRLIDALLAVMLITICALLYFGIVAIVEGKAAREECQEREGVLLRDATKKHICVKLQQIDLKGGKA